MKEKALVFVLLAALLLAACGSVEPEPQVTPVPGASMAMVGQDSWIESELTDAQRAALVEIRGGWIEYRSQHGEEGVVEFNVGEAGNLLYVNTDMYDSRSDAVAAPCIDMLTNDMPTAPIWVSFNGGRNYRVPDIEMNCLQRMRRWFSFGNDGCNLIIPALYQVSGIRLIGNDRQAEFIGDHSLPDLTLDACEWIPECIEAQQLWVEIMDREGVWHGPWFLGNWLRPGSEVAEKTAP